MLAQSPAFPGNASIWLVLVLEIGRGIAFRRVGLEHRTHGADRGIRVGLSNRRAQDRVNLAMFTAAKTPYSFL